MRSINTSAVGGVPWRPVGHLFWKRREVKLSALQTDKSERLRLNGPKQFAASAEEEWAALNLPESSLPAPCARSDAKSSTVTDGTRLSARDAE